MPYVCFFLIPHFVCVCAGLRPLQEFLQRTLQAMVFLREARGHYATEVKQQMLHFNFEAFVVDKFI